MSDMKRHGLIMVGVLVTVVAVRLIFPGFFDGISDSMVDGISHLKSWTRGG
ncbi:hypothetical protein ABI_41920 [Asticcacaulis biprosthecium C19]|uniref:Uncharacterized protein n=1 Tax=Asticcacaulis biprosthecium C19 TaxID=715226 RepID=F4QSP9_9CAUL|nr:hypothetical protein [Asticcacaulis biprosthecium]EGF89769.1 hypothetical protein ABI_41920 [Asticcacaulis biprosthecium C19]